MFARVAHVNAARPLTLAAAGLVALVGAAGCSGVQWHSRLEPALERAARLQQLTLVQFRTLADRDSVEADQRLFTNPEVVKALKDFQCVRLDAVFHKQLADAWGVNVVPTYLILRPDGTLVDRRSGPQDPDEFRAFLRWAALRR
jgi:hypothetical protein